MIFEKLQALHCKALVPHDAQRVFLDTQNLCVIAIRFCMPIQLPAEYAINLLSNIVHEATSKEPFIKRDAPATTHFIEPGNLSCLGKQYFVLLAE